MNVRLAFRALVVNPGLTTAVVLTIGLALSANAALFSVFDGLLFRPLPFRDADRIVHLSLRSTPSMARDVRSRVPGDAANQSAVLIERAGAQPALLFDRTSEAAAGWGLRPFSVTPSFFDLLGVTPVLGRAFADADADAPSFVVILGYDVWRVRFGADPSILNTAVAIPGTNARDRWFVVGIMPPGFEFPHGANLWIPRSRRALAPLVEPYARLAPGVTIEQARSQLPDVEVTPLRDHVRPEGGAALAVLLAATALLLLVAWVQIAGLWLSRLAGRTREIGLRLALGATRSGLMRQFVVESGLLVAAAVVLGALGAPALIALVVKLLPPELTLGQHVELDVRAFVFMSALALAGFLVLAIMPVEIVRLSSPISLLRADVPGGILLRSVRARTALFVAQLAVTTAVVYLAGLTARSFINVSQISLGFDPAGIVAVPMPGSDAPRGNTLQPAEARAALADQRRQVRETMEALANLPGVQRVSGSHQWPTQSPTDGFLPRMPLLPESDPDRQPIDGLITVVFPDYAALLGLRILEGAEATREDLATLRSPPALQLALVSRTFARHLEQFGPPVGQIVALTRAQRFRVIGVVEDSVLGRPSEPIAPILLQYLPDFAVPAAILVRLRPDARATDDAIRKALVGVWGHRAPREIIHLERAVQHANADYRARSHVAGLIAVLCLPLAAVGVAGALSYATRQRTREIAIRLAVGAEPVTLRREIVRRALAATMIALVCGIGIGAGIGTLLSAFLFGIQPVDGLTLMTAAGIIFGVAWLSAVWPARRAAAISPALTLREP